MKLHPPFQISARLLPALHVGDAWLHLERIGRNAEGRDVFRWTIDLPDGSEHSAADLRSGVGGSSLQSSFGNLLCFLGACAESAYDYEDPDSNARLFPRAVGEWAAQHSDELALLRLEIEQLPDESRRPDFSLIEE